MDSRCAAPSRGEQPGRFRLASPKALTLVPGILRIGTYFVNPPFEYIFRRKKVGFEVDLIREIARRLRLEPLFVNTQWEIILQQMQDGRYDCIIGGITITPARQATLAWSDPYMTTTLSLVINSTKTPQIRSLADLKEAEVGVQAATTDYDVAIAMQRRGKIAKVKVYPFDQIADAMTDLAAGRITAVMKVYPVAAWLARQTRSAHRGSASGRSAAARHRVQQEQSLASSGGQRGVVQDETGRSLCAARAQMGRALALGHDPIRGLASG
jgi:ABC-type amino acid transport substrate-binding protein